MKTFFSLVDKFGVVSAFAAAMMMPCCLPLLGVVGATLGLGAFDFDEEPVQIALQGMTILSVVGAIGGYREHRKRLPLALGILGLLLVLTAFHVIFEPALVYGGLVGVSIMAILNTIEHRRSAACCTPPEQQTVQERSTITCPHCGFSKVEAMPKDSCQFFYECENCRAVLRPKENDCCVYCSFGTVQCPPMQRNSGCC